MSFLDKITLPGEEATNVSVQPTGAAKTGFLSKITPPTEESLARYNEMVASQPTPTPSLGSRIATGVKDTFSAPLTKQSFNPMKTVDSIFGEATVMGKDSIGRIKEAFDTEGESKVKIGADIGSAALGAVNLALTPITATLKGLETVPGVGYLASGINRIFGSIGVVGGEAALSGLRALPISDTAKKELEPVVNELGALVGQLVAGKAGGKAYEATKSRIQEKGRVVEEVVKKEMDAAKVEAPAPAAETSPATAEPVQSPFLSKVTTFDGQPVLAEAPTTRTRGTAETLKSESDFAAAKTGEKVDFGELPTYEVRANQRAAAAEFVAKNPEEALRITNKETTAPEGIFAEEIFTALKEKAIKENDVATQIALSKSKVVEGATEMGQRIKALDASLEADPIRVIREVREVRVAAAARRLKMDDPQKVLKAELVQAKKSVAEKTKLEPKTWEDFINSLEC